MHKLLYYPNFEIQDQNFLKFALLYIDEISPIIPENARESLSKPMRDILRNTELINLYSPNYGHWTCQTPVKKYKLYKISINKSLHFAQKSLSSNPI